MVDLQAVNQYDRGAVDMVVINPRVDVLRHLLENRYIDPAEYKENFLTIYPDAEAHISCSHLLTQNMVQRLKDGKTARFYRMDLRDSGLTFDDLKKATGGVYDCALPIFSIEDDLTELSEKNSPGKKNHEAQTARQKNIISDINIMMDFYQTNERYIPARLRIEIGRFYYPIKREKQALQQFTDMPDEKFKEHMGEFVGNLFLGALREKGRLKDFPEEQTPKTGLEMFKLLEAAYKKSKEIRHSYPPVMGINHVRQGKG